MSIGSHTIWIIVPIAHFDDDDAVALTLRTDKRQALRYRSKDSAVAARDVLQVGEPRRLVVVQIPG